MCECGKSGLWGILVVCGAGLCRIGGVGGFPPRADLRFASRFLRVRDGERRF